VIIGMLQPVLHLLLFGPLLALATKSEEVMAPVINMVMMPVLLPSGILLPMTIGPERERLTPSPLPDDRATIAGQDTPGLSAGPAPRE
jgi:hypothetical protein